MQGNKLRAAVVFVAFALVLAFGPQAALAKSIELTYNTFFPPHHAQAKAATEWAKEVEKRTNGQVKIKMFYAGALAKGPQIYEGVLDGIFDIGFSLFAYNKGRFPILESIDLPMGYPNGMVASLAANSYAQSVDAPGIKDVELLYVHAHGPGLLHTKKPVYKLEDLSKMKIRSTGSSAKVVEAVGGVPVAMSMGKAYEALKTGVVEGTFAPIEALKGWKQAEVVKYSTMCYGVGYTTGMYVIMNKNKFASLPKDVQAVITQVSSEWVGVHGAAWDSADDEGRLFTIEKGNKIIPLSDEENARWKAASGKVITDWESKTKDGKALVGELRTWIDRYSK